MSKQIQASTQIKNKEILKQSLTEMGIKFTETGDTVAWGTGYQKCAIDFAKGTQQFDDMFGKNLNGVSQKYTVNLIKANIVKMGHRLKSVKQLANGQVEIIGSR